MKKIILAFVFCAPLIALAQNPYTIVFLNKKDDAEKLPEAETRKLMDGHMANMDRLAKEGKLLAAGPFEGGGGIFIMKTSTLEETRSWISTDPGIQAQRWNVEVLPYTPRQGGVCAVGETYEMTHYSFVRFNAIVSKFTAATYPAIIKKHDEYLKTLAATGNVIAEGIFGDHDGGILIMKGEVQRDIFESDPGVQEALIELEIKKLFIAKGSFCEK